MEEIKIKYKDNEYKVLLPKSKLALKQEKKFEKQIDYSTKIICNIRYDDTCNNGHNTFSITVDILHKDSRHLYILESCGCLHEDIEKYFPEFKHLIKWHLTSSDGPLYYLANTLYYISDRDSSGYKKGDPCQFDTFIFFNDVPIPFIKYKESFINYLKEYSNYKEYKIIEIPYIKKNNESYDFNPKYTFEGFCNDWYKCPFDSKIEAENFLLALNTCKIEFKKIATSISKGKKIELDSARQSAIWFDAKKEDFTVENLLNRLPSLMKEFKKDIENLGFIY